MPCQISPSVHISNAECNNRNISNNYRDETIPLKVLLMYNQLRCCRLNKLEFVLVEVWVCCKVSSSVEEGSFKLWVFYTIVRKQESHIEATDTKLRLLNIKYSPKCKNVRLFLVHALSESCTIVQKRECATAQQPPGQTPTGMNVNCQHLRS